MNQYQIDTKNHNNMQLQTWKTNNPCRGRRPLGSVPNNGKTTGRKPVPRAYQLHSGNRKPIPQQASTLLLSSHVAVCAHKETTTPPHATQPNPTQPNPTQPNPSKSQSKPKTREECVAIGNQIGSVPSNNQVASRPVPSAIFNFAGG